MNRPGLYSVLTILTAVCILAVLSLIPWSDLTGNNIKDFNLIADLLPPKEECTPAMQQPVDIDPEFLALSESCEEALESEPSDCPDEPDVSDAPTPSVQAPADDQGNVLIEFNGTDHLPHLKAALSRGKARIAVIGDSFIEGDIMVQNLRQLLQADYGGSGVGYMTMHTDIPGFRQSVRQSDKNWSQHDLRSMAARDTLRQLSGEYSTSTGEASSTYRGVKGHPGQDVWTGSTFLFISPDDATIVLATGLSTDTFAVAGSDLVQKLHMPGETSQFKVTSNMPGLIALGAYLGDDEGIQVDCMSVRGNSGIGHSQMNLELTRQLRRHIDYDLIIVEYGINALSAAQTNYSPYASALAKSLNRIAVGYPNADIVLIGIADRGAKHGTEVRSLATCDAMTAAQRKAATTAGCAFWDTRAAMGGPDACVQWRKKGLMNADYTHINHAGGAQLAELLYNALNQAINE